MTYKKIYMTFKIKRHMHARVIFRCTVRVSHGCIITAAECGRSRHRPSLGAPAVQYPGL